jgi:hypothetical protein
MTRMRSLTVLLTLLSIGLTGTMTYAADAEAQSTPTSPAKRPVRITIYPLLVQAPIFGAKVDLPSIPGGGGGGGGDETADVNGSTDVKLNAAYLAGLMVETDRVFAEASGTWADISADRQAPRINVKTKTLLFGARAGVRVFSGISATGGVRHLSTDLDVTIELPNAGRTIQGKTKPGYWDPMVGVDWRGDRGRWAFNASFEGGGFGVGTDEDLVAQVRADYRVGFFDLRLGYQFNHIKATIADVTIGQYSRKLVMEQTLNGPVVGFGLTF